MFSRSSRKEKRPDPGDFAKGSDRPREDADATLRQAREQRPPSEYIAVCPSGVAAMGGGTCRR